MVEVNRQYELQVKTGEVLAEETREAFDVILLGSEIKPVRLREKENLNSERDVLCYEEFFLIMQKGEYMVVRQLIEERDYSDSGRGDIKASFIARGFSEVKAGETELDAEMNVVLEDLEVLDEKRLNLEKY